MARPKTLIINVETGEEEYREYTDEEMIQHEKDVAEFAQMQAEREAKEKELAENKASALAKLTALGLSEEEAKAIAGA